MAKRRTRGNGQGCIYRRSSNGPWIAQYYDHRGKCRQRSTRTTDKRAAERILAKFVADEALRRAGVIDPEQDSYAIEARKKLSVHVDDYRKHLKSTSSYSHFDTQMGRIDRIVEAAKFQCLSDVTPSALERALATIMHERKLTAQTRNGYLTAFKGFVNWLAKMKRTPKGRVDAVEPLSVIESEYRRALSPDEAARIIRAAEQGEVMRGFTRTGSKLAMWGKEVPPEHIRWEISGPERALLYRFTLETALRRGTLARLVVSDFDLDEHLTVTIRPMANTKTPRKMVIPLRAETAELLRESFRHRSPAAPAFKLPADSETARLLRTDMAQARRTWIEEADSPEERAKRAEAEFLAEVDREGRRVDFHALRTTCSTWLDQVGVSASLASRITGHLNIETLQRHYHRSSLADTRRAVELLPQLSATGTDGD